MVSVITAVTEKTTYSNADALHAQYTIQKNMLAHSEDPNKLDYSDAGNLAAALARAQVTDNVWEEALTADSKLPLD
jgi:hypothetical protein